MGLSFKEWVFLVLLFSTGCNCLWNSITLLLFDDRKLNKFFLSVLLFIIGVIFICDGLIILGSKEAENLKSAMLLILFFVGLLSSVIIWSYKHERSIALRKKNDKKRSP